MSDDEAELAEELAEEEFCCRLRQLKEDVEVDRLGLLLVTHPPPGNITWWSQLATAPPGCGGCPRVGEEVAKWPFLALTRLWTTPPDGDSSTLYPVTGAAADGGLKGGVGEDVVPVASPLPEEMLRGRLCAE